MKELLIVNRLCKTYRGRGEAVTVLQDVSFRIGAGECLGLVGESGSGKSTLAKILLALERPDSGEILLNGVPLLDLRGEALRAFRPNLQVVFQDPTSSLNQRLPVMRSILEPLDNFPQICPPFLADVRSSGRPTALRLLELVGLPEACLDRYPHELSGGQRQRVAIARGIALNPRLLICDEPTSSLDAPVRRHILDLLKSLQHQLGMSCLFISHDIDAVQTLSDRILVLSQGRVDTETEAIL